MTDPVLDAVEALDAVLEANLERTRAMRERMAQMRGERGAGRSYREIVEGDRGPLLVELLSRSAQDLDRVGARVRRAEAAALHAEGLTMDEIARLFGVSRQRVSALLREARAAR